jgi:23S rRNA (guanosine2251-2'-O)-methyltransferase
MKEWIVGTHPVLEALRAKSRKIHRIILSKPEEAIEILARQDGVSVEKQDKSFFHKHSPIEVHQGVMAEVDSYPLKKWEDLQQALAGESAPDFLVILDEVQDPQNFGALLRSAASFGVQWVLFPERRSSPVGATVVKASAGATEHLFLVQISNLVQVMNILKEQGFWCYGMVPQEGKSFREQDFTGKVALVIGSEGKGLRRLVQEQCDVLLTLPTKGPIKSLNASVAGALGMYEISLSKTGPKFGKT